MGEKKTISNFHRFRLKWMPFANLAIIATAIIVLFQLPYATVRIIEPVSSTIRDASMTAEVGSPFNLRVHIEKTLGCNYQPSSLRAEIIPAGGSAIAIDNLVADRNDWLASNIELPLGEYQLSVSVMAECEDEPISSNMDIKVVCNPLTIAQAKIQGDVCGEFVTDNCGGYVQLPSCGDFGSNDPRINNPNISCKTTGYYVGQSAKSYMEDGKTGYYYTALKCGSSDNKDCYKSPTAGGSCVNSKVPEDFSFYGSKEDPEFHKCRIECEQ